MSRPLTKPMNALRSAWQRPRAASVEVALVLVYLAVLFWAGLIPLKHLPGPEFKLADKVWHAAAFGGLAAFGSRALRHLKRSPDSANRDATWLAVALGGLLEILQSFTAYRSADLADFAADALGAGLAYLMLVQLTRGSPSGQGPAQGREA